MDISTPTTIATLLDMRTNNPQSTSVTSISSTYENYESFNARLIDEYHRNPFRCSFSCRKILFYSIKECNLARFFPILTANEDRSAEISFVLKTFRLWNDENFWHRTEIQQAMRFYSKPHERFREGKLKNFFSILMHDWCESTQHRGPHFLKLKFEIFAKSSSINLFQKLYEIINDESLYPYHHVCLMIIYHYMYEVEKIEGEWSEEFQINRLGSIDDILNFKVRNFEYQIEILKILVVHWNVDYWRINLYLTSSNDKKNLYENYKIAILNIFAHKFHENLSQVKTIYTWPRNFKLECDKFFFRLAFSLKEMLPKKFESEFERYVKFYQDGYGEYWKVAIKPDLHLLLRISDGLELYKTVEFMFKQCPFIALNWNILMNYEDVGEFYEILNEPTREMDRKKMQTIRREFKKIDEALSQNIKIIQQDNEIFASAESLSKSPSRRSFYYEDERFLSNSQSFDEYETADSTEVDIEMRNFESLNRCELKIRENLNIASKMKTKILKKYFKNIKNDRKLLFGRRSAFELSFFEELLLTSRGGSFVNFVWNEFELWKIPELLTMKNPLGRHLLEYVIDSKDDLNLMTFLLPQVTHKVEFKRHKNYMKIHNNLYDEVTGKTLFEFYLEVSMDDRCSEYDQEDYQVLLCRHIIHLLEEIGTINKVQKDSLIDRLIDLAEDDNFYEKIVRPESDFKIPSKNDRRKEKFHIDDLLGRMIVYWKPNQDEKVKGNFYPIYKRRLIRVSPFFELIFNVIENRSKSFKNSFRSKIHKLEQMYDRRYADICNSEYHTSSFTFVMLLAAIQTNQRNVIDFIFDQDIFETIKFDFPSNMKIGQIHYYTALMLLKHGHELGKDVIPEEWVTPAVLYEYFDSQIRYHNQELIEINCCGLLHSETRKTVVKSASDLTEKMMLWDDDRTLEYILNHKAISGIITHPVISTFIELKYAKHKMIFRINFWFFVILFALPFSLFIFYDRNEISWKLYGICIAAIVAFVAKEIFQYQIARSSRNYLKDLTNKIDIPLVILSCVLLMSFAFNWNKEIQAILEVLFIFVMTWDAMTMLPIEAVARTLSIIKRVILTFAKVFCSFALIILAFAFSFRILFGSDELERSAIARNLTISEDEAQILIEREPNMKNFEGIYTTFVKVLVMMAGEFGIEPSILRWYQLILFGIFVVFSFILFNLLLGMSIEDIQNLREDALEKELERKARKFIETNDKFEEIYAERTFTKSPRISLSNRLIYRLSKFFLSEYIYLHNFHKLYVNIRTKEVTVNVNAKQEKVMKRRILCLSRKFYLDDEIFDKMEDIISLRDQENCLNIIKRSQHY